MFLGMSSIIQPGLLEFRKFCKDGSVQPVLYCENKMLLFVLKKQKLVFNGIYRYIYVKHYRGYFLYTGLSVALFFCVRSVKGK